MTSAAAIETEGLTKMFASDLAVNALDLEVEPGSIYGFLGLNGAGKTTTIKLLLNLLYPTSGKGLVFGHDIVSESLAVREMVGYVPEEPVLYPHWKVSEAVNFCRRTYANWNMAVVGRYLDLFGLPVGKKVRDLSKGMKSQLALSLALGCQPRLLILDEPTGGLDPVKTKDFFGVVLEQVAETGQTVFFSSHHLYEVERVADTVGIIHRGRLVFTRSMDDIKTSLKKIRVVFGGEIPAAALAELPGVLDVNVQGRGCLLGFDGQTAEIMAGLNALGPVDTEILDVSLEDVFIRYTGGGKND